MVEGSFEVGDKCCSHRCCGILIFKSEFGSEVLLPKSSDDGGGVGSLRSLGLCCKKHNLSSCSSAGTKFSTDRPISN